MVQNSGVWTQKLNTVRFLTAVMDDGSQLVDFLFSPMYNSSGRIKTANVPRCAVTRAPLPTAALVSIYLGKRNYCLDFSQP